MNRHAALGLLCLLLAGMWLRAPAASLDNRSIFRDNCASCHRQKARGTPSVYPGLAKQMARIADTEAGRGYFISAVAFGLVGPIKVDGKTIDGVMPAFPKLTDAQIAGVMNYVLLTLGRMQPSVGILPSYTSLPISEDKVSKVREQALTPAQVHDMRERVMRQKK